jgi:hypothetical protein
VRVGPAVTLTATLTGADAGVPLSWAVRDPAIASLVSPHDTCGDRCALVTGVVPGVTTVEAHALVGPTRYSAFDVVTVVP